MYIFIVTNSPGEVAGWVKPVVKSLKRKKNQVKIIVVITPCQYASGKEKEVVESLLEVDYVMGKSEYLKYIFLGFKPSGLRLNSPYRGAILFLGGDPIHPLLLSKKLGLPAFSYTYKPRYKRYFKKFMVVNDAMREEFIEEGVSPEKVVVVGDLVGDVVGPLMPKKEIYKLFYVNSESLCISLFPGSRPYMVRYMSPFFLRVGELIKEEFPEAHFFLVLSPFVNREELTNLTEEELNKAAFRTKPAKLRKEEGQWELITESGLKVLVVEENRYEAMSISTMAITIPGTNTHELSLLGIPMIVATPLNRPEALPFDGLIGLMGNMPLLGSSIKRWMVKKYNKKVKFLAIPNRWAKRNIVPEIRGVIQAEDVAREVIRLLRNPEHLHRMSRQLRESFPQKSSADKLAEIILNN